MTEHPEPPLPPELAARIARDRTRPAVVPVGAGALGVQALLGLCAAQLATIAAVTLALGVRPGALAALWGPVAIAAAGLALGGWALGREAIPGRQPPLAGWLAAALLAMAGFALLALAQAEPDAPRRGLGCLAFGAGFAVVPAVLGGLVLRRGHAVRPRLAGAIVGGLSAIVGTSALHVHCPDLSVGHVAAVHGAVGMVMIVGGAALGPALARGPRSA